MSEIVDRLIEKVYLSNLDIIQYRIDHKKVPESRFLFRLLDREIMHNEKLKQELREALNNEQRTC